jgi:hypothetical protein
MSTATDVDNFATYKAAGTFFDGFVVGTNNRSAVTQMRDAVNALLDSFDQCDIRQGEARDRYDDVRKYSFAMRAVMTIAAEEIERRNDQAERAEYDGE